MFIDARIPLRFGHLLERMPDDGVLTDGAFACPASDCIRFVSGEAGHPADCTCCWVRGGAATALATLFRVRVMSRATPFRQVLAVVTARGEAEVRDALVNDRFVQARYRLA